MFDLEVRKKTSALLESLICVSVVVLHLELRCSSTLVIRVLAYIIAQGYQGYHPKRAFVDKTFPVYFPRTCVGYSLVITLAQITRAHTPSGVT